MYVCFNCIISIHTHTHTLHKKTDKFKGLHIGAVYKQHGSLLKYVIWSTVRYLVIQDIVLSWKEEVYSCLFWPVVMEEMITLKDNTVQCSYYLQDHKIPPLTSVLLNLA
jgi:hypothetical protein